MVPTFFVQESEEYHALERDMSLLQQRFENERQETIRVRVELEKARKELLMVRAEQQSSTLRFDLDSQRSEVSRLNQIIEAMTAELETTKNENAQVRLDWLWLATRYEQDIH